MNRNLHMPHHWLSGVVFNSPHSGVDYPPQFLAQTCLPLHQLRMSEDFAVNHLFSGVVSLGMPLMEALFPRSYLDLNREAYEFDAKMFHEELPSFANPHSPRVLNGLGTIAKFAAGARPIYEGKIDLQEALMRVESLYHPYHRDLKALLMAAHHRFGEAVLIDCHSMPSLAGEAAQADIVIGDHFGRSAAPTLVRLLEDEFRARGYFVVRNRPYAGGFITQNYGTPQAGIHAIQIEINRGLYMDEENHELHGGFHDLQRDLTKIAMNLRDYLGHEALKAAAE
jgi:N-formylglutamate amidohydrolase